MSDKPPLDPPPADDPEHGEFVWIHADHVPNMEALHQIMVAVHPDSGAVLDPQPPYPEYTPPPPPEPTAADLRPSQLPATN